MHTYKCERSTWQWTVGQGSAVRFLCTVWITGVFCKYQGKQQNTNKWKIHFWKKQLNYTNILYTMVLKEFQRIIGTTDWTQVLKECKTSDWERNELLIIFMLLIGPLLQEYMETNGTDTVLQSHSNMCHKSECLAICSNGRRNGWQEANIKVFHLPSKSSTTHRHNMRVRRQKYCNYLWLL